MKKVAEFIHEAHKTCAENPLKIVELMKKARPSDYPKEETKKILKNHDRYSFPEQRLIILLLLIITHHERDLFTCCEAYDLCFSPSTRKVIQDCISDYLYKLLSNYYKENPPSLEQYVKVHTIYYYNHCDTNTIVFLDKIKHYVF